MLLHCSTCCSWLDTWASSTASLFLRPVDLCSALRLIQQSWSALPVSILNPHSAITSGCLVFVFMSRITGKKTVDRFRWNFLVGWVLGLEKLDYLLGVFQLPVIVEIVYLDWSSHWVRVLVVCCVFFHQILQMVLGARKIRYSFGSNLESGRPWT